MDQFFISITGPNGSVFALAELQTCSVKVDQFLLAVTLVQPPFILESLSHSVRGNILHSIVSHRRFFLYFRNIYSKAIYGQRTEVPSTVSFNTASKLSINSYL